MLVGISDSDRRAQIRKVSLEIARNIVACDNTHAFLLPHHQRPFEDLTDGFDVGLATVNECIAHYVAKVHKMKNLSMEVLNCVDQGFLASRLARTPKASSASELEISCRTSIGGSV